MTDWLTYQEAAAELGIGYRTLLRRIRAGHIRPVRPKGGQPRIDRRELNAYRAAAADAKHQHA